MLPTSIFCHFATLLLLNAAFSRRTRWNGLPNLLNMPDEVPRCCYCWKTLRVAGRTKENHELRNEETRSALCSVHDLALSEGGAKPKYLSALIRA